MNNAVLKSSRDVISGGTLSSTLGEIAPGKKASPRGKHIIGKNYSENTESVSFPWTKTKDCVFKPCWNVFFIRKGQQRVWSFKKFMF